MRRRDLLGSILLGCALAGGTARAAEGEKLKKSGGDSYLPIATILGTIVRARGRRGVLSVDCGLDVPDAKLRELADASMPRLRAAYVQTVQIYAGGLSPGAPPNVDFIAQALQRQTDAVLGRPGARLLMGSVLVN